MFAVALQAAIGDEIILRETASAIRKKFQQNATERN
jgi:translation elongation factor EF-4